MAKSNKRKKGRSKTDPYRAREAKKYENPIASREYILDMLEANSAPLSFKEIAAALELHGPDQREALSRRLSAMTRDGQVILNRRGGYCVVNKRDLVAGRVVGHPDGFGFLIPEEGGEDLFLTPREMKQLWHGDRVVAQVTGVDARGRREGSVAEILERNVKKLVGRIHIEGGVGILVPDNKRQLHEVLIPADQINGAANRQMVQIEITVQPDRRRQPIGHVIEVLGDHMAPGMETEVALRNYDIPTDWSKEVKSFVKGLGKHVPESQKKGRVDLRKIPLVTIDGEDARDFDDAVYCERKKKGWKLLVCIADVSSYVMTGAVMDEEAINRGNSVYFPDRVVPMLPEALSNGLCSLNPQVDRLCMTAELFINDEGEIYRSRFYEAVMCSHARLTYNEVSDMLVEGDASLCEQYADLLPHLHELYALYQVLNTARSKRGAIDFDTTETRFRFTEEGRVLDIVPLVRNDAHKIIEECMLAANVATARFLQRKKMPALYRIHDKPSDEKLIDLHQFLGELGLKLEGGLNPTAKDYANLLDSVRYRQDAHLIQVVLLRSMMQAVYCAENVGHFGLAFPAYAHFTSPIRRYPDLLVHRAIKHVLAGGRPEDFEMGLSEVKSIGEHCSMTERRADEATRDVVDTLKCEFMLDKVGGVYTGVISSVNSFGVFVELDDIYVTGLIHVTALDYDYFHFDPVGHKLVGERSGKTYRLGDAIQIQVAAVNLDDRKIDFVLAEGRKGPKPKPRKKGRGSPKDARKSRSGRSGKRRR